MQSQQNSSWQEHAQCRSNAEQTGGGGGEIEWRTGDE